MNTKLKNYSGITLIALIITIIILVILAAVSIRAINNAGIVGHAINGTQDYLIGAKAENKTFDNIGSFIDNAVSKLDEIQGNKKVVTPSSQKGTITLAYSYGGTTNDGKVRLQVIPTVSKEGVPSYEEYATGIIANMTDSELKTVILKYFNTPSVLMQYVAYGMISDGESIDWGKAVEIQGIQSDDPDKVTAQELLGASSLEETKARMVEYQIVNKQEYAELSGTRDYFDYALEVAQTIKSDDDLKETIIESITYQYEQAGYIEKGQKLSWAEIVGEDNKDKSATEVLGATSLEQAKTSAAANQLIDLKGYSEKYLTTVTIKCNGEEKNTIASQGAYVEFEIAEGGEYPITGTTSDGGSGETVANVIIITPTSVAIETGDTTILTSQGKNETLVWTSSNPSVATVNNGVVTGVSQGTARITVTDEKGDAISNECIVTVTAVPVIRISPTSVTIVEEETTILTASGISGTIQWRSSDESVATVENGVVTGISAGTTTITATNEKGNATSNSCTIKVERQARILDDVYSGITWTTLSTIAKQISADPNINSSTDEITTAVEGTTYTIAVGDIKRITIGTTTYQAEILGFKHDNLVITDTTNGTNDYGSTTSAKAGISFQLKEVMTTTKKMNSSYTNAGGWAATDVMYSYLNTDVYASLETTAKSAIVTVGKKYMAQYNAKTVTTDTVKTSNDKLWLLSCSEIWNTGISYTVGEGDDAEDKTGYGWAYLQEGEQYKYYLDATNNNNITYFTKNTKLVKKNLVGTTKEWWLRSPDQNNNADFCMVYTNGQNFRGSAVGDEGVAFGFAI